MLIGGALSVFGDNARAFAQGAGLVNAGELPGLREITIRSDGSVLLVFENGHRVIICPEDAEIVNGTEVFIAPEAAAEILRAVAQPPVEGAETVIVGDCPVIVPFWLPDGGGFAAALAGGAALAARGGDRSDTGGPVEIIVPDDSGVVVEDEVLAHSGQLRASQPGVAFVPQVETPGSFGSFTLHDDGAWVYELDNAATHVQALPAGQRMTEVFRVATVGGATAEVPVTILGTNDPPVIAATPAEVFAEIDVIAPQDLADSGTVSFGDIDAGDVVAIAHWSDGAPVRSGGPLDPGLAAALVDGFSIDLPPAAGPLALGGRSAAPGPGTLSVSETVAWTYLAPGIDLKFLAAGETIRWSYSVTATDSHGARATDRIDFRIDGRNDAPTVAATDPAGFVEAREAAAQNLSQAGTVGFGDIDAGDRVSITYAPNGDIAWSDGTLDPALATALVDGFATGVTGAAPGATPWSYDATGLDLDFLLAGETITWSYTITATDAAGATATDTLAFTITGTSDPGDILGDGAGAVVEDTVLTDSGTLTIFEPPAGVAFVAQTDTAGGYGSFTLGTDGGWSYTLDNAAPHVQALRGGETVTEVFAVATTGGRTTSVTITVTGLNDPAVIGGNAPPCASYSFLGEAGTRAGVSVAMAGDIDGDGRQDYLIGTELATSGSGISYLVHADDLAGLDAADGTTDGVIRLANVGAAHGGYRIIGESWGTGNTLTTVAGAGDALLIGQPNVDAAYLLRAADLDLLDRHGTGMADGVIHTGDIYGASSGFVAGPGGYLLYQDGSSITTAGENFGFAIAALGDIDGRGLGDFLISNHDEFLGGEVYLIHGEDLGLLDAGDSWGVDRIIDVREFTGLLPGGTVSGYRFIGLDGEEAGYAIASAGRANPAEGTDILIGARSMLDGADRTGGVYLFNTTQLNQLDTASGTLSPDRIIGFPQVEDHGGYRLHGSGALGEAGTSVSFTGDVDGDGRADILVGGPGAGGTGGLAYLVTTSALAALDAADGTDGVIDLANVGLHGGYIFEGAATGDGAGLSVMAVGDIDGDGKADLAIGAAGQDSAGAGAGAVYLILSSRLDSLDRAGTGTADGRILLADVGATHGGFRIDGAALGDEAGTALSGQIGGTATGAAERLLIGAPGANGGAGAAYLIDLAHLGATGVTGGVISLADFCGTAPPVLGSGVGTVIEDTAPATGGTLTVTDVDTGEAVFVVQAGTAGTYGSFTLAADGTWTYTLDNDAAHVQALSDGETVTEIFAVATADGTTGSVTVTVIGTNDPAVTGPDSGAVQEDGVLTATGTLSVIDPDAGEAVFVPQTATGSYGSFTLAEGGGWSYTLDNDAAHVQALRGGETVTEVFAVATADGTPTSVTITVTGANDPAVTGPDSGAVTEDGVLTATGTLAVIDPDTGEAVFVAQTTTGTHGSFTLAEDGGWTYTLDNDAAHVQALRGGETVTEVFAVATADGTPTSVTITVTGANDPAVTGPDSGAVTEDGVLTATGTLAVIDPDTGEAVFVAQTTTGTHGSFTLAEDGGWTYTLDNDAAHVQALRGGETVTEVFAVATADGTATAVTVTVTGANDPAVTGPDSGAVAEDGVLTATGTLTVTDIDTGEAVFVPQTATGSYGSFTLAEGGGWTYTLDNTADDVQALRGDQTVTEVFAVATADGTATSVTITVTGASDIGEIIGDDRGEVQEDGTLTDSGTLAIFAPPAGALFVAQTTAGTYGSFTLGSDGAWTYTLDNAAAHVQALRGGQLEQEVFAVATDYGTSHSVTIDVAGANDPAVVGNASASLTEDVEPSVGGTLSISDPDAGEQAFVPLTDTATNYGSFTIDENGNWTFTPDYSHPVYDGLGLGATAEVEFRATSIDGTVGTVTITINGAHDAAETLFVLNLPVDRGLRFRDVQAVGGWGDFNNDGFDDVLTGFAAHSQFSPGHPNYKPALGQAYVEFGRDTTWTGDLPMRSFADFIVQGGDANYGVGTAVDFAGDVNGDGYDDIVVTAIGVRAAYVIYGRGPDGSPGHATLTVSNAGLPADQGFMITTSNTYERTFGFSVSGAGDVNGDGFDDVIVGKGGVKSLDGYAGRPVVVYGSATGVTIDIDTMTADQGFRFLAAENWGDPGTVPNEVAGYSVSGAGDINGDGFDDLIIGVPHWGRHEYYLNGQKFAPAYGKAFVLFGSADGPGLDVDLRNLPPEHGFMIGRPETAAYVEDEIGYVVSGAGDVNGDGFDDFMVTVPGNATGPENKVYLFYGKASGWADIDLTALAPGTATVLGGRVAAAAGDVNGDGYDDIIIGNGEGTGWAQVYYGSAQGVGGGTSASAGFRIQGTAVNEQIGRGVSGAGDLDGDGFDDLLVEGRDYTYIIWGGNNLGSVVEYGIGHDFHIGSWRNERLFMGPGDDTVGGGGGIDFLSGGSGADTFLIENLDDQVSVTILDFLPVQGDLIDLSDFGFADFAAVRAVLIDDGPLADDSRLQLDHDTLLILEDYRLSDLDAPHFILV